MTSPPERAGGLAGRGVLVVGASAGIGRSFAVRAAARGARVVAAARRAERLDEVVAEMGGGTAVAVDVRSGDDLDRLAGAARAEGPLDVVLYAAAGSPLRHLADTTARDWEQVLATNVIGYNAVVRAVLPHLAPAGVVAALSSEIVAVPRSALGAYAASKAALEASIRGWRTEHPGRRFACVRVGATQPTEFANSFDAELLGPVLDDWLRLGLLQEADMVTDDVATVLAETLAVLVDHPGVAMEDLVLRSPSGAVSPAAPVEPAVGAP